MDILVIDDDPDARKPMVRVLERAGFMVAAVENGLAGLATMQDRTFQVIVCDIRMPFLDGIQFYGECRRTFPELASRVLFVTAFTDHPEVQAFLRRTGQPVVAKPYEIAEFVQTVQRLAVGR